MPLLTFLQPSPEVEADTQTSAGAPTLVLRIRDLAGSADDTLAPGELFFTKQGDVTAADFTAIPAQERTVDAAAAAYVVKTDDQISTLDWPSDGGMPVIPIGSSFVGMTARLRFPNGYVKNHRWISGDLVATEGSALLPVAGAVLRMKSLGNVLTVDLDPTDHRKATRARASFVATAADLHGAATAPTSPLFKCGQGAQTPAALIASAFDEAADLHAGSSSFTNEAATCDAVSVGLGLQLVPGRIAALPAGLKPFHYECDGPDPKRVDDGP